MATEKNLLSGSAGMLVLSLLAEQDMYGYQMIDTLAQRSNKTFEMKAGTLYPLLHQLEQQGSVTVYEKTEAGRVRKYYAITQNGRKHLSDKQAEWHTLSAAVNNVMGGPRYALSV